MPAKGFRKDQIKAFFEKFIIDENTKCWNWTGQLTHNGYGRHSYKEKGMSATRVSWNIHKGEIDFDLMGILVCHKCDNPACVNPDHLFLGTQKDNMQDCVDKNRINKGTDRPQHILTEENVKEARRLRQNEEYSFEKLSNLFGVSKSGITNAIKGNTWKHVDYPIPTFHREPGFQEGHQDYR